MDVPVCGVDVQVCGVNVQVCGVNVQVCGCGCASVWGECAGVRVWVCMDHTYVHSPWFKVYIRTYLCACLQLLLNWCALFSCLLPSFVVAYDATSSMRPFVDRVQHKVQLVRGEE